MQQKKLCVGRFKSCSINYLYSSWKYNRSFQPFIYVLHDLLTSFDRNHNLQQYVKKTLYYRIRDRISKLSFFHIESIMTVGVIEFFFVVRLLIYSDLIYQPTIL